MKEYNELVSLCVVAYNEEAYLPDLLENFKSQDYPHSKIEIILVDGNSTDNTKNIMSDFSKENDDFYDIVVLDNPKRKQAAGWNVAIMHSHGGLITRIDSHTYVPSDFLRKNVDNIIEGEVVSGGVRPCLSSNKSKWGDILLRAENSLFGSSINSSRHSDKKRYVKTMFHATYKREVFDKAGLFNENLLRTEDNEMHYRIRRCGYKFCYDPNIKSYQYSRNSLRKMIKQKYGNGYWIGLTLSVCPKCLSLYHFVPFAFVVAILITTLWSCIGFYLPAVFMWVLYGIFAILNTVTSSIGRKFNQYIFIMPLLFLILHISYGIGTLVGFMNIPRWLKNYDGRGNK